MQWMDTPRRYGTVTRLLHWTMALLLAWQFTGMALKLILGKHPVSAFFVGTHGSLGAVLFVLLVVRLVWALCNTSRRPARDAGAVGWFARAGHTILYLLMLVVPALALLRAYGSGKGFTPFGVQVMPATGERVDWMVAPASAAHGLLAWTLLALVAGHIIMVVIHRVVWRDDIAARMIGPTKSN